MKKTKKQKEEMQIDENPKEDNQIKEAQNDDNSQGSRKKRTIDETSVNQNND